MEKQKLKIDRHVSFDYDGTLGHKVKVQEYCIELIKKDYQVHITTSRFDNLHCHLWRSNYDNNDLWITTHSLNINKKNVHFMNFEKSKADYLKKTNVIWHLDDDEVEIKSFNKQKTVGIHVNNSNWKEICNNLLNNI